MPTTKAPTAINLGTSEVFGTTPVDLANILVTDDGIGATLTVVLSLSDTAAGTFGTQQDVVLSRAGTIATITGTSAVVNAALAALTFTPAAGYTNTFAIHVRVADDDTRPRVITGIKLMNYVSTGDDFVLVEPLAQTATTINGGTGSDTLIFNDIAKSVSVNLAAASGALQVSGVAGKYTGFEHVSAGDVDGVVSVIANAGGSVITTGRGADKITLGAGADTVSTGNGSDTIIGLLSAGDEVDLGGSNDSFTHSAATAATVDGGDGNDTLVYSAATAVTLAVNVPSGTPVYRNFESISAGKSVANLTIVAGSGITSIITGKGNDVIDASALTAGVAINPGAGASTVTGSNYDDRITLGSGADSIDAGSGSDTILGKLSIGDNIRLGAGADAFTYIGVASTSVDGGSGVDTLLVTTVKPILSTDPIVFDLEKENQQQISNDAGAAVYSNFENLNASALKARLKVIAHANTTLLITGKGDDDIDASAAAAGVSINGNGGADTIVGSDHDDTITYYAQPGATLAFQNLSVDAGDGTDTLIYSGSLARLIDFSGTTSQIDPDVGVWLNFENLSAPTARGQLTVVAGAGTTAITAGRSSDYIDASRAAQGVAIDGGQGTNTVLGSDYGDTIVLGTGTDILNAGAGSDTIVGSASSGDQLNLGTGDDSITYAVLKKGTRVDGGDGADTLAYNGAAKTFNFAALNNVTGEAGTYQNFENLNASTATGALTVTANANTVSIVTGAGNDNIAGADGDQTLRGGAGNDTLAGNAGSDVYVFEATGAANGTDVFGADFVAGTGEDVFDFSLFLGNGSIAVASLIQHDGTSDTDIGNKVVLLASTDGDVAEVDTAAEIAALIQDAGDAMALASGAKAVIVAGDASAATPGARIWFVDDSLGATPGTIEADDIRAVAMLTLDIDTLVAANVTTTPGTISYSGTSFDEATANDGSVGTTITLTLTGDTFAGTTGAALGTVSNVPAGLTAVLVKASATTATLSFTGTAASHVNSDDIANLTVTFADGDFTGGSAAAIRNTVKSNLGVDFDDPAPIFTVTETTGVVTFGGTATGDITVALDGSRVATFTRQGIVATTTPDLDTVTSITVGAGQTLVATVAQLGSTTIDGSGTVALTALQASLAADLSGITATTVTAAFADDGTFTGGLGTAAVTVAATKTLTLAAAKADGKTIGGAGNTVLTDFVAATEYALAGVTSSGGTVSATLAAGGTLHADTIFNSDIVLTLADTSTLSGSAAQLSGVTLVDGSGTANVAVTALGTAAFDAGNVDIAGTLEFTVNDADVTLHADTILAPAAAASTTVLIADSRTLTASAAQVDSVVLTAAGTGKVNITGAAGAQSVTGTGGDDTLAGGAGDDVLDGGAGDDTYVFAATGAANGSDTLTFAAADDVLDFSDFLAGGSVELTALVLSVASAATGNADASNKVLGLNDGGAAPTVAALAALFKTTDSGADNYFVLNDDGKAIIIHGDDSGATRVATIYFVDAALDATGTDLTAADIVIVGVTSASIDLATLAAGNFSFV
jgi:Ca2+-binding RTX toxin-like protein